MWLPNAIASKLRKTSGPAIRFGGASAGSDAPAIVGSLRPDTTGDQSRLLPGIFIMTPPNDPDVTTPWGPGGAPLSARGDVLHDSNGEPLV